MADAIVLLGLAGSGFAASVLGVRSGRWLRPWTIALALSGAGLVAGALLVQDEPDLASWLIGPPVGAILGVANIRSLYASGGPLRT
jgi:hypothetical protein